MNWLDLILSLLRANAKVILSGVGTFVMLEGAANIWYWWDDKHPWYFQLGRLLRTVLGFVVIVIGGSM